MWVTPAARERDLGGTVETGEGTKPGARRSSTDAPRREPRPGWHDHAMESPPAAALQRCLELAVPAGDGLALALSGGSDSVALLALLRATGRPLTALHVDHGLRPEAAGDAAAVADLCARLEVPCRVLRAPPAAPGQASETAARRRRLAALAGAARDLGCPWVLTAHHLDDALETALLHLRRGHRGLRALAGVPTLRPLVPGVTLLRPLLCGPHPPGRTALEAVRRSAGLPVRDDVSNRDRSIPRNALRALLAEDRTPLDRARLARLRRRAQRGLQERLARAIRDLAAGLTPVGRGLRVERAALGLDDPDPGALVEALRLLGASLDPPRRLRLRATVLERVRRAQGRARGHLELPCDDGLLAAEVRADGLHLPGARLAADDPLAALLGGLSRTSLFL